MATESRNLLEEQCFSLLGSIAYMILMKVALREQRFFATAVSSDVAKYFDNQDYKTIIAQTLSQSQCNDCFTMLEIHDWTRFLSANPGNIGFLMSGLAYLLTAPGIPIIYYGLEQGLMEIVQVQYTRVERMQTLGRNANNRPIAMHLNAKTFYKWSLEARIWHGQ